MISLQKFRWGITLYIFKYMIQLLSLMWNQCIRGDFTLVTNALAREYARSEIINQCQGIDQSGDDDMSDTSEGKEIIYIS